MIGAGNRGYFAYGEAVLSMGDARVVAVAEPDEFRRERFAKDHSIIPQNAVADWKSLLSSRQSKLSEVVTLFYSRNRSLRI
jgi:predicted dehydrogenase